MRFFAFLTVSAILATTGAAHAQSHSEAIARVFNDVCVKHAPKFEAYKIKAAFNTVANSKLPRGVSAFLSVTPAKSCYIDFRSVPLNADGTEPDIPLAMEKKIMSQIAERTGGELSVYRQGRPWESWSVKVGKERYRLQSIYKKRRNSWSLTIGK